MSPWCLHVVHKCTVDVFALSANSWLPASFVLFATTFYVLLFDETVFCRFDNVVVLNLSLFESITCEIVKFQ